jgi:carbonic anhydrase/acetyltransferase-like protein (isoleucine patch superfamily)
MQNLKQQVKIGQRVFIAPNATVLGNASLGDDVSVWFGAVIRADGDSITIGARSNIQDNAVIHVDPGFPTTIGHSCIVGHLALVHGASIGNHVLVGMHSTILNGAVIGDYCMIGANALVTAGTIIPPYSLVLGVPAKVVKTLTETQIEAIHKNAEVYVKLKDDYLNSAENL